MPSPTMLSDAVGNARGFLSTTLESHCKEERNYDSEDQMGDNGNKLRLWKAMQASRIKKMAGPMRVLLFRSYLVRESL